MAHAIHSFEELNQLTMDDVQHICCLGATRVGVCTMVVMASRWPNKQFSIVDTPAEIARWQHNNNLPLFEPQLQWRLGVQRNQNLQFSDDMDAVINGNMNGIIEGARVVFVAVEVSTKTDGEGMKEQLDFANWKNAFRDILAIAGEPKLIVEKCAFPIEVAGRITNILEENEVINPTSAHHQVFFNPDFYMAGHLIADLLNPSMVIISCRNDNGNINLISELYQAWVPINRIITDMTAQSARLGKMASDVILAINTDIMNFFAVVCDKLGGNIGDVERIVQHDERINRRNVKHNAGISAELQRDVQLSAHLATGLAFDPAAKFFRNAVALNKRFKELIVKVILETMDTLKGAEVAIMGFSCKEGTSEIEDTPALHIIDRLIHEGANVRIFDPRVRTALIESCCQAHGLRRRWRVIETGHRAETWEGADGILFLQRWDNFLDINYTQVIDEMNWPAYFFDACDMEPNRQLLVQLGFVHRAIGRPNI